MPARARGGVDRGQGGPATALAVSARHRAGGAENCVSIDRCGEDGCFHYVRRRRRWDDGDRSDERERGERHGGAVRWDGARADDAGGRKSFMLSGDARASAGSATVRCRLHRRGDGWETLQVREIVDGKLRERNVLKRPGMEDVVVDRYFKRKE
ncbi:hypothetical protein BE221DRAFT_891 [Ostreococcus tauri]|uniref:Uncharacterized protein n=1 Tax=Ostreococcus tauri TaxID=70448 RepID=A0A1Y5I3B0_OSTTA|nr:hypothetical protein BE221DRAFT_891 [Ostreococcus tauri]